MGGQTFSRPFLPSTTPQRNSFFFSSILFSHPPLSVLLKSAREKEMLSRLTAQIPGIFFMLLPFGLSPLHPPPLLLLFHSPPEFSCCVQVLKETQHSRDCIHIPFLFIVVVVVDNNVNRVIVSYFPFCCLAFVSQQNFFILFVQKNSTQVQLLLLTTLTVTLFLFHTSETVSQHAAYKCNTLMEQGHHTCVFPPGSWQKVCCCIVDQLG